MAAVVAGRLADIIYSPYVLYVVLSPIFASTTADKSSVSSLSRDYSCDTFPDFPAYLEQWQRQPAQISSRLYPYGTTYCDSSVTREQYLQALIGFDPRIDFSVPYFGKLYNSLWVSPNGFIALSKEKPANPVPFIWYDSLPNPQYPNNGAVDPPLMTPFYAEADMLSDRPEPSAMYFRVLDVAKAPTESSRQITEGMLWHVSTEIRAAVVGADNFQATHGIIVTWYQVTFTGNDCTNICARNTYQTAVVTDGTSTFAVYSYQNMTWVGGGANQNCDRLTGTRSNSSPYCKPGHAGFNAGYGQSFHALPYSGLDRLSDLDIGGGPGSNVTGRYYYKVSGDTIVRGGCTNNTGIAGPRWHAEIFPKSGGMLGGEEINISGPCFNQRDRLKCRFDNNIVDAVYLNNIMRVTCIAPTMAVVGPIRLGVSTDGGNSFPFETEYVIVTEDHITPKITLNRQNDDWLNPGQMELIWSPQMLTPRPGDRVDIKLFGYREDSSSGTLSAVWEELQMFVADYSNSGVFTFNPEGTFTCQYNEEGQKCVVFDVGAFQINVVDESQDPANPRRIWSRTFPLGWYIKNAMTQDQGESWISNKCQLWYNNNYRDSYWLDDLDPCPCTFAQAYADFGRYQPDPLCSQESTEPMKCERKHKAEHCVLSVYASSSGSGNQCCYDASGQLIYSGDTHYGSLPQRSHVWGATPYGSPPKIPQFSHWQNDLTGFYYCCEWQQSQEDCHRLYLELRRTRSCEKYETPGQALAFGDPHYQTFDDVFYTFNGYGEFWLMQVTDAVVRGENINFKLQARFEQPANQSWGETKATYMTAVGMQLNDGQKIVVRLNRGGFQKNLLIHIDDYLLDLTPFDHRRQELQDLIIINNNPVNKMDATNFTIVYRCGIGVNIVYKNDLIDLVVSAPPQFKDHTRGLLGRWNGDPSDDLDPQNPGGPIFDPGETENIHRFFGLSWMVTNAESCFEYTYRVQLNYNYYNRYYFIPNYSPKFPPNNTDVTEDMVKTLCGDDKACTFDYKTTLNANIGKDSLSIQKWDEQRREMGKPVVSCGWLNVPYSVKAEPLSYVAGSTVTITGCIVGYTLEGPTQYTCQNSGGIGQWSPEVTTMCRGPGDPLPMTTVLAISIPIALIAVILVIVLTVVILWLRKKKKKQQQAKASKQALVDIINNENSAEFNVVPPLPEHKQKPPRPEPNLYSEDGVNVADSTVSKLHYDNQVINSSDESGQASMNHVSWDMRDEHNDVSDSQPVKTSTLVSNKSKVSMNPSPKTSPSVKKRKRPYHYPTETADNSREDHTSRGSDSIPTYCPRDVHSYTQGHNIPTHDSKASDYYRRKYAHYRTGY